MKEDVMGEDEELSSPSSIFFKSMCKVKTNKKKKVNSMYRYIQGVYKVREQLPQKKMKESDKKRHGCSQKDEPKMRITKHYLSSSD